jgi:hypothetical protein
MKGTNEVMVDAGYLPAAMVAAAIGKALSTVHRMVQSGKLRFVRDGTALYIETQSLNDYYKGNIPMLVAISRARTELTRVA